MTSFVASQLCPYVEVFSEKYRRIFQSKIKTLKWVIKISKNHRQWIELPSKEEETPTMKSKRI